MLYRGNREDCRGFFDSTGWRRSVTVSEKKRKPGGDPLFFAQVRAAECAALAVHVPRGGQRKIIRPCLTARILPTVRSAGTKHRTVRSADGSGAGTGQPEMQTACAGAGSPEAKTVLM